MASIGCGNGSKTTTTSPPDGQATQTSPSTPGTDTRTTSPEDQPGGAGDEEPPRTEVTIEASSERLSPAEISVAAYLPVKIIMRSADGRAHNAQLSAGGQRYRLEVKGGRGSATVEIPGLKPGIYYLKADDGARAAIRATTNPGP